MISRDNYINKLINFKDKEIIKVITGIRRCGKSTLLSMFQDYLISTGIKSSQILSINFEDMDYSHISNADDLYKYLKNKINFNQMSYIFLDEVQQVENFQKAVDSLYIKKNIDIYISGSNAKLLSGEIATLLSGRYIEIEMLPLSFKEYVSAYNNKNLSKLYRDYLEFSSFPYAIEFNKHSKLIRDYLSGVYSTVVLKDVVNRNRISDVLMLESVIRFLFDNIGNIVSTKKISDTMTSSGRKISTPTVESYVKALIDSFIIYQAKRYDIKGKQHLKTLEKYYVVDIGLRYFLLGSSSTDVGHILENIIYLELLRRDYNVYIGKVNNLEVDFIAKKQNETIYYQVSATVRDKETLKRELKPLENIKDDYPKFILTLDEDPEADYEGIKRINALDFLIE